MFPCCQIKMEYLTQKVSSLRYKVSYVLFWEQRKFVRVYFYQNSVINIELSLK